MAGPVTAGIEFAILKTRFICQGDCKPTDSCISRVSRTWSENIDFYQPWLINQPLCRTTELTYGSGSVIRNGLSLSPEKNLWGKRKLLSQIKHHLACSSYSYFKHQNRTSPNSCKLWCEIISARANNVFWYLVQPSFWMLWNNLNKYNTHMLEVSCNFWLGSSLCVREKGVLPADRH